MHSFNLVCLSGEVVGDVQYGDTGDGTSCCGFLVVLERTGSAGVVVRINVYFPYLVQVCRAHVKKGVYVIVRGELMGRVVHGKNLIEVRAREMLVTTRILSETTQ